MYYLIVLNESQEKIYMEEKQRIENRMTVKSAKFFYILLYVKELEDFFSTE